MNLRATIDAIKERTDLRQIIPDVRKSGSNWMVCCPAHVDSTPSMVVHPTYCLCYGCGASFDIISYYEHTLHLDFMEALRTAALDAGIVLDDKLEEQVAKMVAEREKRQEDLAFYRSQLEAVDKPRQYLQGRGLTPETIEYFQLGYRPDWDAIAIPIFGRSGNLDSISFRYLDPNNEQRYHHKNNETWTKGESLYNARVLEFEQGTVYVCEGMFDVMSIWQAGFTKVVGIMGGSLNDYHVRQFGECPVVFIPDRKKENDFDLFKKSVFRLRRSHPELTIRVAMLPSGDANSNDPEVLKAAIGSADYAELAILKADLETCEDVDQEYKMARKVATDIADPLTKDDITRWLATRWDKDRDVVKQALSRSENTPVSRVLTITDALNDLEERERTSTLEGVTLGCFGLGQHISRPHTSQIALIAARANVGKTLLALNMLHAGREFNVPSLFLSMEQPASELAFRLSLMASSDLTPWNSDQLSAHIRKGSEEWKQGLRHLVEHSYPNLRFREDRLDPMGVRDAIIDASYSLGERVKIVYIDYLGLMAHAMRSNDSYERMSAIGRDIQAVTKEMDVFGVYLVQLSRKGGDGSDKVTLDMMRDSGVLEEVADYIIGAWRGKDRNQYADMGISEFFTNVCKNRHGSTGEAKLWMNMSTLLLFNTDYAHSGQGDAPNYPNTPEEEEMPVDPF